MLRGKGFLSLSWNCILCDGFEGGPGDLGLGGEGQSKVEVRLPGLQEEQHVVFYCCLVIMNARQGNWGWECRKLNWAMASEL